MDTPRKKSEVSRGGGFFAAMLTLIGAVVGGFMGEGSAGFLIGLGLGIVLIIVLYYLDKRANEQR
jgi:hypothetical protein